MISFLKTTLFIFGLTLAFFDSYIYEIQNFFMSGLPILNIIRTLFFLLWVVFISYKVKHIEPLVLTYFLLIALYLFSGYLFSDESSRVSHYLTNFVFGFLVYWTLSYFYKGEHRSYFYNLSFFVLMLFFLISLFIESFGLPRLTMHEDALWQCGKSWNRRMCGATNNPNILGFISFLMMSFAIVFYEKQKKLMSLSLGVFSIVLSYMALSRTAIVAIFLMIIIFSVLYNKKIILYWILFFLISLITMPFLDFYSNSESRFSINSIASGSGRSELFMYALGYIDSNVILGSGLNFQREYVFAGTVWKTILDNAYLNIFVSYGVIGLLVFLTLLLAILKQCKNVSDSSFAIFICFMIMLFVEDFSFKGYYIWVVFALVFSKERTNKYMSV
ncbi:O-antigen ligase family protein [Vibrio splendidus]|uniref:O-antigen ligase family protein n=1 Tax=Vibrio splendidus TaxID=29497 RepID=UPI001C003C6D|nr:O-antigen ligase family protein [Vibrio splendidus]MBT9239615.1 O-antigen ligase family protein [Vibrio splendidus]MDP2616111.1 O-antigen ligase family protein [Vibrio splendidus]